MSFPGLETIVMHIYLTKQTDTPSFIVLNILQPHNLFRGNIYTKKEDAALAFAEITWHCNT